MRKTTSIFIFSLLTAIMCGQANLGYINTPTSTNSLSVLSNNKTDTNAVIGKYGITVDNNRFIEYKQLGVTLESVTKTIYVSSYTGNDLTGDGNSWSTAFATYDKAIDTIGNLLDVTVTVQMDSGTYYASKESIRAIEEMKANANVDILSKGMTDTITILTSVTQDNDTLFKYYTLTDLSTLDLDSAYVEGTFRLPIHSNGNDYVILATAESSGVGSVVTKNKTTLIVNDADHIVLNYISEYSRGGITFQNLKFKPLGNKALRLAAFGTSKLKFDGCDIQSLNVQNNNVIINQCHIYATQRGIVLNNYNSFIEQSVIYGPGKLSGNSCFDVQNGNVVIDNLIIDGFGQVFENSQGLANITFYDNSADLYITNCNKVFSANDGFYLGSGDLNRLVIDNVDYLYKTISDKNVGIILDTSMIVGSPLISYVESDNGIRIKPEKNYVAYIRGVHDSLDYTIMTKRQVNGLIGGSTSDILINKDGNAVNANSLYPGSTFTNDGLSLYMDEPVAGSYFNVFLDSDYPSLEYSLDNKDALGGLYKFDSPFEKQYTMTYDSTTYSYGAGHFEFELRNISYSGVSYHTKRTMLYQDTTGSGGGMMIIPSILDEWNPTGAKTGSFLFYDKTGSKNPYLTNIRLKDSISFNVDGINVANIDNEKLSADKINVGTSITLNGDTRTAWPSSGAAEWYNSTKEWGNFNDTISLNWKHNNYNYSVVDADFVVKYYTHPDSVRNGNTALVNFRGDGVHSVDFGKAKQLTGSFNYDNSADIQNFTSFMFHDDFIFYNIYAQYIFDTTKPFLISAEVGSISNDTIMLTFSEPMTIDTTGWRISINDTLKAIDTIINSGTAYPYIVLLNDTVIYTDTVKVSYLGGNTEDVNNNILLPLADSSVVNNLISNLAQFIPTDQLLLWLPFDGNAFDMSGNKVEMLGNTNATLATDRFGNAYSSYYFDSTAFILYDENPIQIGLDDWSMSFWTRADLNRYGKIVGSQYYYFNVISALYGRGYLTGSYSTGAGFISNSYSWKHVVVTYDRDNGMQLYINNAAIGGPTNISALSGNSYQSLFHFCVGATNNNNVARSEFFKGEIDDIAIYKKVLSTNAIDSLFNAP